MVALFWSLFQTRKVINPDDIVPLVEELKVNAELLVDYFDSIASKLKIEADRIYYPKSVPYEVNCKVHEKHFLVRHAKIRLSFYSNLNILYKTIVWRNIFITSYPGMGCHVPYQAMLSKQSTSR